MPVTRVRSRWDSGSLVFYNDSNVEIARLDHTNASFDIRALRLGGVDVTATAAELNAMSTQIRVINNAGALTAGTLVAISGYDATDGVAEVAAAGATAKATHVLIEDNAGAGAISLADEEAIVTGIDTDAFVEGQALYLAAAGGEFQVGTLTGADQILQAVGVCIVSDPAAGSAYFFPGFAEILRIGTSGIQNASITSAKLDAGIVSSSVVRDSVRHTWAGGAAPTDTVTITGVDATDQIFATINVRGSAVPTTVVSAERSGGDTVTITLDQNGEDGVTIVSVMALRDVV